MARNESKTMDGGEPNISLSNEQNEPLLFTKLFNPPIHGKCIVRPQLDKIINEGLEKTLTLVTAPAGYGKTTLVSGWLSAAQIPSTWISLDEDDNDPIRFFQYFIMAVQKIIPAAQLDLLAVLQGRQSAPYITLVNLILNLISKKSTPFVFVLDDFHTIQSKTVLDLIFHLIEHTPPQMHVVLLSRSDPPIPLSRLRARNQMIEIRVEQLRFNLEEAIEFLNEIMGLSLSPEDIAALETRTEGWIAGLQLAAISMQGGKDVHGFVSAFSGSHYYIMDYLIEEVLNSLDESIRLFLLRTSILDRMCGPLCDKLEENTLFGSDHGQATLEMLEKKNLFIVPLDNNRRWYRYHHLFADVLNRRLEMAYPDLLPELHRNAAGWYEQNGYFFEAINQFILPEDRDHAACLLDQNGCQLLMRGELVTLLHWIEAVEPYSQNYPWIMIQKIWSFCLTGQLDRVETLFHTADQIISQLQLTDNVRTMLGAVTAARAYRANMQGNIHMAVDFARQSLAHLPVSNNFSCSLRSAATSILGDSSWLEGNLAETERAYTDAVRISEGAGNLHMMLIANANLGEILLEQGRLQSAFKIYSESLKYARLPDGQLSPLIDHIYAGLSRVLYEWNQLDESKLYNRLCIENAQRWETFESLAVGFSVMARLEFAKNNIEKAGEAIRSAEQTVVRGSFPTWRTLSLQSILARLWIAQGDYEKVVDFIHQGGISGDDILEKKEISYLQEPFFLISLRLFYAQGNYDAALALSEQLLQALDRQHRIGRVVEVLILQALAFQGKRENEQALMSLEKAFSIARPEGYKRVFLDEGEPMAKLLYYARSHRIGIGYESECLSDMGIAFGGDLPPAGLLIEPLTERELQVLKLIETGLTNQEIAMKYVISVPTVKRHISNIYTKLDVTSRTQAVARSKELGLFK